MSTAHDIAEQAAQFVLGQLEQQQQQQQQQQQETQQTSCQPHSRRILVVGISGTQGIGKTTLTENLAAKLSAPPHCLRVHRLSVDDLYLTHAEQCALATAHPGNALLAHRGLPGTHDVPLGGQLLRAFRAGCTTLAVPRYDKARYGGQGDRTGWEQWSLTVGEEAQKGMVDVLLFEGWCLGFAALDGISLARAVNSAQPDSVLHRHSLAHLEVVNACLPAYETSWYSQLDLFIHLDPQSVDFVYAWREQQEQALRARTGTGMSILQVRAFVDTFMVGYGLWLPALRRKGLSAKTPGAPGVPTLRLTLDADRKIANVEQFV
ncbi:P-loop containing nucleoside triphosphate hydrolase protein [Thamnocephalis sphaerospora]|uniref:P-loop containing nucleoside triphosphate hydrolase protein n=1 Tax=Thamnocephalis sphaerospora TaxID=78915 RepID=A0A4P9XQQ3_9FUNG|nr:P-loop containing nucleoside triphosphate hydrolase protein [Thamnocephalis sphaerospora]|eukprot:RKP08383.1 P-loop containing nucleoside triphosphate hydrolase protein [Thamnocephalis sphaerospora]